MQQTLNHLKQYLICQVPSKCGHFNIVDSCKHCQKIQGQWYKRLKKKGFDDIEDQFLRLLKKWTGVSDTIDEENPERSISLVDLSSSQEPNLPMVSSWPDTVFNKEEELLNNPDLQSICEALSKHGNNVVSPATMVKIFERHCEGYSLREIEKQLDIHYVTIFRAINRLREMAKLMDEKEDSKTIIIRHYNSVTDAPLLFASWRNCLWFENHPAEAKPNPIFYRMMTKKINLLLKVPNTNIKIACLQDDPNEIKGYAVLSGPTIEMVYVKLDYRKQGIATLLTKGFVNITKPITKIASAIANKKNLKIKENQNVKEETDRTSLNGNP